MGQLERKQREQEIRKSDILDAAERVFFSKGYEHASMDEIAKEAEFSKRTVYVYFRSKEQIYFEIMIRGYRLLIHMLEKNMQDNPPENALEELRCIFFSFYRFSENSPMYFHAIMEYETTDTRLQSGVEDESKKECYQLGEQLLDHLSHALKKGAEEGSLKECLMSRKAALILWACTIGVFNTCERKSGYLKNYQQVAPNELVTCYFDMLMELMRRNGEN